MKTDLASLARFLRLPGLLIIAGLMYMGGARVMGAWTQGIGGQGSQVPAPGKGQERELANKITAPFTVATVGDIIEMRPISQFADPDFQSALQIVRDADVSAANLESSIADLSQFVSSRKGSVGTKEVAMDIRSMGFKMINRANNWFFVEGMPSTNSYLDAAGIVQVGSGKDLEDARAARFLETPKGRVGMVGMVSVGFNPTADKAATYPQGNAPGNPGVDPVNVTRYTVVTPEELEALRKVRNAVYQHRTEVTNPIGPIPTNEPTDRLQLFGEWFKAGTTPGDYSYTMNP